jgi:hypothetical protein
MTDTKWGYFCDEQRGVLVTGVSFSKTLPMFSQSAMREPYGFNFFLEKAEQNYSIIRYLC